MAKIQDLDRLDCEGRLAEERFLLLAQVEIQKLLNEKKLRYRDLSKRLGVSEARVSQMFGDEASNLTIRTIARVFHQLDETPVLISRREFERLTGNRPSQEPEEEADGNWEVLAEDVANFTVVQGHLVSDLDGSSPFKTPRNREWIDAAPALLRKA
ncbi:helix-turn-helix transcriptional regulator [Sphingomonas sp. KR3-1]|uniref:helix-turn-helix domain-containing protein n=1 Tax=Sphingomonas sp. KR3-1 TaxID=3156611 RepID=UPI0032B41CDB